MDPPRRWSIRSAPEGLHPGCDLLRRTIVRLDGKAQRDVRAWDCEAGELVRIARDEAGRVMVDQTKTPAEVLEERLAGVVTVELAASVAEARAAARPSPASPP